MTQFNKRALECLIKVGAFDEFGARAQLLAVMDQMIGLAATERRAVEQGQGMLFAMLDSAGADETAMITLPARFAQTPQREMLSWEKELAGTYVSAHPLSAALEQLTGAVSHTTNQLDEAASGSQVVVAGVIQSVRPHTAKSGKQMAFAVLEDMTGTVELTVFPRTFDRYQSLLVPDRVVLVYGKAEFREGRGAQILVDRLADSVEIARPVQVQSRFETFAHMDDLPAMPNPSEPADPTAQQPDVFEQDGDPPEPNAPWFFEDVATVAVAPKQSVVEPPTNVYSAQPEKTVAPQNPSDVIEIRQSSPGQPIDGGSQRQPLATGIGANNHLLVVITRCGDPRADIDRLQAVHGTLLLFQGEHPFSIRLKNGDSKDMLIDFPNDGTRDCDELRDMLRAIGAQCMT